jgi:hypothetical protein
MSANYRRGARSARQSQEGSAKCQPITGGEREVPANHRRGAIHVSQSQEGSEKCQPITGGERSMSANHRRGARSVSQSQKGSDKCQAIIGGEQKVSGNHRRGAIHVSQSQEGSDPCQPITGAHLGRCWQTGAPLSRTTKGTSAGQAKNQSGGGLGNILGGSAHQVMAPGDVCITTDKRPTTGGQSTLGNVQSTLGNIHSTVANVQNTLRNVQSTLGNVQSTIMLGPNACLCFVVVCKAALPVVLIATLVCVLHKKGLAVRLANPLRKACEGLIATNHRRGARSVSQSQEGSTKCQPITGEERKVSANHRRGARSVSQSQEGSAKCQPITGGEPIHSARHVKD